MKVKRYIVLARTQCGKYVEFVVGAISKADAIDYVSETYGYDRRDLGAIRI